ncbi:microtubule-associated protein, putative [Candida dubliniensis CD36]|uniref:Nuclear fusion protein, putative n=1 Tax=Candida dubliniensis (strain CD36 / ATCC MYA-646 / CBS 7987 / NCPF 3949 / NRRL Y-17841) TaxID=573826 RepID=B9WEZ7_CANDC|nr:microtubule-associated protein, putative [Candida dubliniensis CD36]CAX43261.1 microtubule-associated protein, putative [Candida dubliniensis CD36]
MGDVIGTKVAIPGASGAGIIRYVGQIQGKIGTFAGVELLGTLATTRGKNSGSVDGIQYFQVEIPKSGLFLPYERLKSVNPILANTGLSSKAPLTPANNRTYQNVRNSMINENLAKSEDLTIKYESEIAELQRALREKEKRLENFNNQREEWRAAMDELVAVQQEGIQVYEDRIEELENENKVQQEKLDNANASVTAANSKIKELEQTIENLLSEKVNDVQISDTRKEIEKLKHELESRPRLADLEELQNSLDELESIYQERLNEKDAIITKLQVERDHLSHELYSTPVVQQSTADDSPQELPIYKAAKPTDPSQGKNDWCGLCERDGHSSINCPYENDIF